MNDSPYDFVVLGGGSAGYAAARTAVAEGLRTAVFEDAETMGGLCILRGCMPSKTLIESANRAETVRRAAEYGLHAELTGVRAEEIVARKRRLIGEFAAYRQEQLQTGGFDLLRGKARFETADSLEFSARDGERSRIGFRTALVSTGSVISRIPVPGLEESGYLTSDDILDLDKLPDSVVVLGGGPIALEMAHYLHGVGVRTTVIQRSPHVLSGTDHDVADALANAMRKKGIDLRTGTQLKAVERDGNRKIVRFLESGKEHAVEGEDILQALGRSPNVEGLGLDAAGLADARGKISVSNSQQSSVPHIFAAGDVCGPYEIVHIAIQQGEIAARNAAKLLRGKDDFERIDYRLKLYVVFTEPQVATVGLTEAEASEAGIDFATASYPFNDHGKSLVMGETDGFVKLLADRKDGRLLGGAVVGPHAADLIHEITVAMAFHATAAQLAAIPHYHPTLSEIWTYPAEELG